MRKWYIAFADAVESDGLQEKEVEALRKEYERILQEVNDQFEELMGEAGLSIQNNNQSQESTKRGFESMSQDTGEELNGRFTALQMAGEEIKTQNLLQTEVLAQNGYKLDAVLTIGAEQLSIADETRNMIVSSYLELQGIRENTGAIVKPIKNMSDKLDNIERKIQTL